MDSLCENMNDPNVFATLIGLRALHIYWLDHYQSTNEQVRGLRPWKESIQWQCYRYLQKHFIHTEAPSSGYYKSDKEYFLHVLRDMEIEQMFDAYVPYVQPAEPQAI